jgi:hypothetical protein
MKMKKGESTTEGTERGASTTSTTSGSNTTGGRSRTSNPTRSPKSNPGPSGGSGSTGVPTPSFTTTPDSAPTDSTGVPTPGRGNIPGSKTNASPYYEEIKNFDKLGKKSDLVLDQMDPDREEEVPDLKEEPLDTNDNVRGPAPTDSTGVPTPGRGNTPGSGSTGVPTPGGGTAHPRRRVNPSIDRPLISDNSSQRVVDLLLDLGEGLVPI